MMPEYLTWALFLVVPLLPAVLREDMLLSENDAFGNLLDVEGGYVADCPALSFVVVF